MFKMSEVWKKVGSSKTKNPDQALEDFLKEKTVAKPPESKVEVKKQSLAIPGSPIPKGNHVSLKVHVQVHAPQAPKPPAPQMAASNADDMDETAHKKILDSWTPAKGKLTSAQVEARAAWAKRMNKLGDSNK